MKPHSLDPVLVTEAARICKVSPQTIRQWERIGRLRSLRTAGGVRVFDRPDIERLASERQHGVVAEHGKEPTT